MIITQELKIFIIYLFSISAAETVTSLINSSYGLILHFIILLLLFTLSAVWENSNGSNLFLCLSIAPLIRIFSLSLPLSYLPSYSWYLIAGLPMFIAAVTVVRIQHLSFGNLGFNFKKPLLQMGVMFTGIPFGILEYLILKPVPIVTGLSALSFVLLAIGFIVATGFVEEFVFRGIFQNNAIKSFGTKFGLVSVSLVFAVLHIGWLNIFDIILVFAIGLFFSLFMLKTGSIVGISLSHGFTNVFLFLVMPSVNLISFLASK